MSASPIARAMANKESVEGSGTDVDADVALSVPGFDVSPLVSLPKSANVPKGPFSMVGALSGPE